MAEEETEGIRARRKLAVEIFHTNITSQFSRLNFFLAGTAFLIVAFAAVITVNKNTPVNYQLHILAHAINAVGCYLAFFFTFTNFLNGVFLKQVQDELMEDGMIVQEVPYRRLRDILKLEWKTGKLRQSSIEFLRDPVGYGRDYPASHTWLIPLLFLLFWLVTWFAVLRPYWIPSAFGIALPLVLFLYIHWRDK